MQSTLLCFEVGVVLFSLTPPTMSFSRGANHASCQEMIPGHIRAQPQYPQHSHVTLRTSASSYLPGQLITVTVRSSRDFMGFLLQARSAEGSRGKARAGVGVKARTRFGAGVRSARMGPVLVGGSWTFTPPGTHTLRCLSEGDTLTHSDKQLKRNLSFVWRAPDTPMGDIRFYITVVQSYFVYWAGIESAVVSDRSHSPWSGSNTTQVDRGSSDFSLQEDEFTVLPAFRPHGPSNNETAGPATTLGPSTKANSATQIYKSLETPPEVTLPVMYTNSSTSFAALGVEHMTNQAVNEWNSSTTLGSLQNATKGSETDNDATSGYLSVMTEEASIDKGSPVTHTEDPNSPLFSTNHLPFKGSLSSDEAIRMKGTTTLLPNITVQNSSSQLPMLHSFAPFFPRKYGEIEKDPYFQISKLPTTLNPKTTTAIPSTSHSFPSTKTRPTPHNPRKPILDQTSSVMFETQSSSSQPWSSLTKSQISPIKPEVGKQSLTQIPHLKNLLKSQTSSPRPFLELQTSPSKPFLPSKSPTPQSFLQSHPFSLQHLFNKHTLSHNQFVSDLPKSQPENSPLGPNTGPRPTSPPHPQLQTTAYLLQPQPPSSFLKALSQTIPTQTQNQATFPQTDQSHSDIPPEDLNISSQPWSHPHSQTEAPPKHTFGWKQSHPSVTPGSSNPILFTSRRAEDFIPNEGKEVHNLQSPAKISAFVTLTTPFPYFSGSTKKSTLQSSSSTSIHTLLASFLIHRSSTTPLYPSGGSTLVSMHPLVRSTLFAHSSSSSKKNQPKTAPALSALLYPSPISIPPHFSTAHPSSTSPVLSSLGSSTKPSLNPSTYPPAPLFSPIPLSTSFSPPFISSQYIAGSTFSLPSSSTISPILSSSSIVSLGSFIPSATTSLSPPPFSSSISTSTLTSSSKSSATSSSSMSFHSTTPHPGPSPVPRRSLYNPLMSSSLPMPSQKLTLGQTFVIQNHIVSSNPEPSLNPSTPRTVVHPNPEPYPNLNPNFKLNFGHDLKPNIPNTDTKPKRPSSPSGTPDQEGKYPDIVPRHSAWELGMLLGCSAGLGMVLVVGVRYIYRQACGKQTEMTLNDREREYGRGERGLIHVQECGDLVRVQRIRENSFVLLAEYDILASPGD